MNSMAYVVLGLLSLPAQAAPSSGAPSAVQPATFDPVAADTVERRTEPPSRLARGTSDSATEPDDASPSRTTSKKSSGGKTKLTPVAPQAVDAFATNPQKYQVSDAPTDAKKRVTASVSSGPQRPAASATSGPSANNLPLKLVDTGPKAPSPSPAGAKPSPKAATASVKSAPSKPADVKPTERKIADAQTPSRGATPSVASAPSKTHVASDSNSASTKPASGMFANLRESVRTAFGGDDVADDAANSRPAARPAAAKFDTKSATPATRSIASAPPSVGKSERSEKFDRREGVTNSVHDSRPIPATVAAAPTMPVDSLASGKKSPTTQAVRAAVADSRPASASVASVEPKIERPAAATSIASPRPATASVAAAPEPKVERPAAAKSIASPRPATASVAAAPEPKVERPAAAKAIASPRPATASVAAAPAPRVSTPAPAQQFAKANVSAPPTATFAASTSPVATLPVPAGWQPPHAQQPRVASEPSAHRSISAPARTPALTAQVAPALPPKIEMSSEASRAGESIAANQLQTLPTSPLVSTGARRAVVDSAVVRATPVSANVSSPKSASFARYQGEVAPTPAAPKPMPEAAGARQPEPLPSVHEADSGYTAIPWGDWLAGEGEYCEDCDECCRDRCGIIEQRQNIRSAARQMGQHQPYQVWPWTYYYFRAYDYRQIHELQHQAEQWGGNPRQPQARDLFEKLYEELAPKLDSPEPFVEGPKPEAK